MTLCLNFDDLTVLFTIAIIAIKGSVDYSLYYYYSTRLLSHCTMSYTMNVPTIFSSGLQFYY